VLEESGLRLDHLQRQIGGLQLSRSGRLQFGFVLGESVVRNLLFPGPEKLFHQDFGVVLRGFDF